MYFFFRVLACIVSLAVLSYGTLGLANHQHLHLIYLAMTAAGVIGGVLSTHKWPTGS